MAAAAPQFLKWLKDKVASTPGFDDAPEVAVKTAEKINNKDADNGEAAEGQEQATSPEPKQDTTPTDNDEPTTPAPAEPASATPTNRDAPAPAPSTDATAAASVASLSLQDNPSASQPTDTPAGQSKSPAASTPAGEADEFVLAPEAPVEQLKQAAEPVPAGEGARQAQAGPDVAAEAEGETEGTVAGAAVLPSMKGYEALTAGGVLGAPVPAH